jgi:hypothetical protein
MSALQDVLDGEDTGAGVSHQPWEGLRRRLLAVMAQAAVAAAKAPAPDQAVQTSGNADLRAPDTREMKAISAMLGAMHDQRLNGARVREAMQWVLDQGAPEQASREVWKCFHCGEICQTKEEATLHFGKSEIQEPICKVDQAKYRELEALVARYANEDSDVDREFHAMQCRQSTALRREEEKGYAKGLADGFAEAKKLLTSLGRIEAWAKRGLLPGSISQDRQILKTICTEITQAREAAKEVL